MVEEADEAAELGIDLLSEFAPIETAADDGESRVVLELVGGDMENIVSVLTEHTDVTDIRHVESNEAAKEAVGIEL